MKPLLLYPIAFYVFYTFIILIKMFFLRVKSIKSKKIPFKYFSAYEGSQIPRECVIHGRHFDNQFQLPMIFFITCLTGMNLNGSNIILVSLAWLFIASRIVHSIIHLGTNDITKRLIAYASGWIIVLSMWGHLILF